METTKEFFKDLGVVALIFVIFFLAMGAIGCGDGGTPVYNDQGECIANCGDDVLVVDGVNPDDLNGRDANRPEDSEEDGFVQPDDGRDADAVQPTDTIRDCGSGPDAHCSDAVDVTETDLGTYECPYTPVGNAPPSPFGDLCLPEKAKEARCAWDGSTGETHCTRGYNPEQGYIEGCTSDEECQWAPLDEYPPCVCWQACRLTWFIYEDGPKTWYCGKDYQEVETEDPFIGEFHLGSSFKDLGANCGVPLVVNEDIILGYYTFFPDSPEKKDILFSKEIKMLDWTIPAHYLVIQIGMKVMEVHRETDGKILAMCYVEGYWGN